MHRLLMASWPILLLSACVFLSACGDDEGVSEGLRSTTPATTAGDTSQTTPVGTTGDTSTTSDTSMTSDTSTTTSTCVPTGEEVCDDIDNDCDGETDEGFVLTTVERCGSCDNACAFSNATAACEEGTCVLSACEEGFEDLDEDPNNGCESAICVPTGAGDEICDDADNDCDGNIDEDFGVGSSQDHCLGCNQPCALDNAQASCNAGICSLVACEDGFEDLDGDPNNGCESAPCVSSGEEVCDGVDNDCDGEVDEDFDLTTVERCGECGNVCSFENGAATCEEGVCVLGACEAGFVDLDGDPNNGCEYACAPTNSSNNEIACDGEDNNCNGEIDEGSADGSACTLADGVEGSIQCAAGSAQCVATPNEDGDPRELCGAISGALTAEGGPYIITCPEVFVDVGETLTVLPNVRISSNDTQPSRLTVRGRMQGAEALWTNVEIVVEGSAELDDMTFLASRETSVLLSVNVGTGDRVVLRRPSFSQSGSISEAVGLHISGVLEPETLVVEAPRFISLGVGVSYEATGALEIVQGVWEGNQSGVHLQTQGAQDRALSLRGGEVSFSADTTRPNFVEVVGEDVATEALSIALQDLSINPEHDGALAALDPDMLEVLSFEQVTLDDADWATIRLVGAVDQGRITRIPVYTDLPVHVAFSETLDVRSGSALAVPEALYGEVGASDAVLRLEGNLQASEASLNDVAIDVQAGGMATLVQGQMNATETLRDRCLVSVAVGGMWNLSGAILNGHEELDGLCVEDPRATLPLDGAHIQRFRRGLTLGGSAQEVVVEGVTFLDDSFPMVVETDAVPIIRNNVFRSTLERRSILMTFRVGSQPGGQVLNNTFDVDVTDVSYDLDPDTMSAQNGTLFGPNVWPNAHPGLALLSGTQTSPNVSLYNVTELDLSASPFWDLQVVENVNVLQGSTLTVDPSLDDVLTFYGPSATPGEGVLHIEGDLVVRGPNVIFSNLPVRFAPNSTGTMTLCTLISSRSDLAMIDIEDSSPVIGGQIATKCTLTGAGATTNTGITVRASSSMCTDIPGSFCPFIAANDFRDLGIGVEIFTPASFRGVNDFDDANPQGDSVPRNTVNR